MPERGSALLIALLMTMLIGVAGAGLILTSVTETGTSANYRRGVATLYAAESGVELAIQSLALAPDWTNVLAGHQTTPLLDSGPGWAPDGTPIDVFTLTAALQAEAAGRLGSGVAQPLWRPYVRAPLSRLLPDVPEVQAYVVVWVADDLADDDGNPDVDSNGRMLLHGEAYGEASARRVVEATIARPVGHALGARLTDWREIR